MSKNRPRNIHKAVTIGDSAGNDAFSRLRVSDTVALFDSQLQYNTQSLVWDQVLTGNGTVTHLPNESAALLTVAASGDKVVRQTRQYHRYQPGKSQVVACTLVLGETAPNVRRRVGYFDAANGIFLEQTSEGLALVRRTFVSGAAVDNRVTQSQWNIDPLNGNGHSDITIDPAKAQILIIDLQWLGVGRVRVGFDVDGVVFFAHEFLNANNLSTVYMTTANLPLRYEIEATGAISSSATLRQICCMVASEGGFDEERGYPRSAFNGITPKSITGRAPVLSIRPKATFNSITNRGLIVPESVEVYASGNAAAWELVYNGAIATTPSWVSAGANSIVEYDVSSTAITGGDIIQTGFVPASAQARASTSRQLVSRLPITLDIAGSAAIVLSVVATSFTGTSTVAAAINWREIY